MPTKHKIIHMTYTDWMKIKEPFFFKRSLTHANLQFMKESQLLYADCLLFHVIQVGKKMYKLDGANYKEYWDKGLSDRPETFDVRIINWSSAKYKLFCEEQNELMHDSLPVTKQIVLAYETAGLTLTSERLRNGQIYDALNIALRGKTRKMQDKRSIRERNDINLNKAVLFFKQSLQELDSLEMNPSLFLSGVISGALVMLTLHPQIIEFFKKLNNRDGEVNGLNHDPVISLIDRIGSLKITHRTRQTRMNIELCRNTTHAVNLWMLGKDDRSYWRRQRPLAGDHMPEIWKMKKINGIHADKDL